MAATRTPPGFEHRAVHHRRSIQRLFLLQRMQKMMQSHHIPLSYSLEHDDDEIDLWMIVAPVVTGGIGYSVEGARVLLPSEDVNATIDFAVDTRESEPFAMSASVRDSGDVLVGVGISEAASDASCANASGFGFSDC